MLYKSDHFLFVEKYRPKKIDDCILPDRLKSPFKEFVKSGSFPSLLLTGGAGVGKTTVAKALCNELDLDVIVINASLERNISILRDDIAQFASTVSFSDNKKVVILDEADHLNAQSTQPALRGFIEEFSSNCTFILTCNYKNRIIEPIHSRTSVIDFAVIGEEKNQMMAQFMKRVMFILEEENIKYDQKAVGMLIKKFFPDYRRVLNELQRYGASGEIQSDILTSNVDDSIMELVKHISDKKFNDVRIWVSKNPNTDYSQIYRRLYDELYNVVEPQSIPDIIEIISEYDFRNAQVQNQDISFLAAIVNIMSMATFK